MPIREPAVPPVVPRRLSRTLHARGSVNPVVTFDCGGEHAAQLAECQLGRRGFQVVRSFDLLGLDSDACDCPHHGTPRCTCQYSILLVYSEAGPPVPVIAHSREARTRFEIAADPNVPADADLVARIMAILLETSVESRVLPANPLQESAVSPARPFGPSGA